jgi:hypothetical protein
VCVCVCVCVCVWTWMYAPPYVYVNVNPFQETPEQMQEHMARDGKSMSGNKRDSRLSKFTHMGLSAR